MASQQGACLPSALLATAVHGRRGPDAPGSEECGQPCLRWSMKTSLAFPRIALRVVSTMNFVVPDASGLFQVGKWPIGGQLMANGLRRPSMALHLFISPKILARPNMPRLRQHTNFAPMSSMFSGHAHQPSRRDVLSVFSDMTHPEFWLDRLSNRIQTAPARPCWQVPLGARQATTSSRMSRKRYRWAPARLPDAPRVTGP